MQRSNHRTNRHIAGHQKPRTTIWTNTYSLQQGETRSRSAIADKALELGGFSVLLGRRNQSWRQ